MEDKIRMTDLKNWAYCARVVFYHRLMPEAAPMTYKMESGLKAQELVERLEAKRTLDRFGFGHARRIYGRWLTSGAIGLSGRVDLILAKEDMGEAAVVDCKLTSGDVGDNHRLQLWGYAALVEEVLGLRVSMTFLWRVPDERIFEIPYGEAERGKVEAATARIREMVGRQVLPEATPVRARCTDCEYVNFCGDVW